MTSSSAARAVRPLDGPIDAVVQVPGSKSLTNRALVCAGLATGTSVLEGALFADDTEAMLDGLDRLGIGVAADRSAATITVDGCAGTLPAAAEGAALDARLSGTTARFLLPVLALGPGPTRLDGAPQLRARPMADGIAALRALGAEVDEQGEAGHLPVEVRGPAAATGGATRTGGGSGSAGSAGSPGSGGASWGGGAAGPGDPATGGVVAVAGEASSQFLSGLLLAAPARPGGLRLTSPGALVSRPYVDMTVAVLRAFGADAIVTDEPPGWTVAGTGYRATRYRIEPDASAASYFFAAAAIVGGRVTVDGLGGGSLQGDLGFVDVLARMGCDVDRAAERTTVTGPAPGDLTGVDVDLRDLSDTAPTLAVVAAFAASPTRLRGIGFIRAKESDRIGDVVHELQRCGIEADEEDDGLVVHPGGRPRPAQVATYDDHRMAMSFALLGLRVPGIEIADPGVVAKTFPGFWDALDGLRGTSAGPH
jgi:3-phosphoshikimate 1-carboxyvinyltransferase